MANMYRSVLSGGGGVQPTGDAVEANVLAGKTFSNANGIDKTGTMPNNGAVSGTATPSTPYVIPAGYHNGSGVVSADGFVLSPISVAQIINGSFSFASGESLTDYVGKRMCISVTADSTNVTVNGSSITPAIRKVITTDAARTTSVFDFEIPNNPVITLTNIPVQVPAVIY